MSSFRVHVDAKHRIILEPNVEVPADEGWLFDHPAALAQVKQGLADSAAGRTHDLGRFAHHLDGEDDA